MVGFLEYVGLGVVGFLVGEEEEVGFLVGAEEEVGFLVGSGLPSNLLVAASKSTDVGNPPLEEDE